MSGRVVSWAAAVAAVLGAVQALAINKVDAGTAWQVAAVTCTLLAALLAGWLASRAQGTPPSPAPGRPTVQRAGSVDVGGTVGGSIRTRVSGTPADTAAPPASTPPCVTDGDVLGPGAVRVGETGQVGRDISTHVTGPDGPTP